MAEAGSNSQRHGNTRDMSGRHNRFLEEPMPTIQPSAFAVVATNLAQTDRRTLSQAWFDALHLAHERTISSHAERGLQGPLEGGTHAEFRARVSDVGTGERNCAASAKRIRTADQARSVGCERRSERSELSRRIERAVVRRTAAPIASIALKSGDGRVQLLVRSDGNRTRIVALCLPAQRCAVEAALAQTRFALARRGITIDADVRSAL